MNLVKCPNGHFYDANAHSECPYCKVSSLDMEVESTMAHSENAVEPKGNESEEKADSAPSMDFDVGKTMGMYQQEMAEGESGSKRKIVEPVVGWVICVEGESKGEDFRLHSERNFIGRDGSNDVVIAGDPRISRKNHATISFNPKKNDFKIFPGDGRGIVYLNDEEVYSVQPLKAYDVIELGDTKLVFMPFCGEAFKWGV